MLPRCFVFCVLLLAPSVSGLPQPSKDIVRFGRNIAIASDQPFHNVSCFLCSASVEGRGTGSVRVFAGNIFLNGSVGGNILVFGGNVTLTSNARVGGHLIIFGGHLHQEVDTAAAAHTVLPPIIFLPIILLICGVIGWLIVLTRRMVREPAVYPPLPRL
jgi:hypothetical protein